MKLLKPNLDSAEKLLCLNQTLAVQRSCCVIVVLETKPWQCREAVVLEPNLGSCIGNQTLAVQKAEPNLGLLEPNIGSTEGQVGGNKSRQRKKEDKKQEFYLR